MRFAKDKNGNRVFIDRIVSGEQYLCPICNSELTTKMGNIRIHHFAHKKGCSCHDTWHYDMSEWHKKWQDRFPEEYQEVVKEYDGKKHRADVLIENSKIVIEFQHSKISMEEFNDRNNFYTKLEYKVVWVFDFVDEYENDKIYLDENYSVDDYDIVHNRKTGRGYRFPKSRNVFNDISTYKNKVIVYCQIQNSADDNQRLKEDEAYLKENYYIDDALIPEESDYYNEHKNDKGLLWRIKKSRTDTNLFHIDLKENNKKAEYSISDFISQIENPTDLKDQTFDYTAPLFELWVLFDCNWAIFYNTQKDYYVKINDSPDYYFEKYNGRCYGYISKDRYSFPSKSQQIFDAEKSIWRLIWKK